MNVLIGCEESQIVCNQFRLLGHNAISCDLKETRGNSAIHYQRDIMDAIPTTFWDLIILHPDCTAMALCGNRWYGENMPLNFEREKQIKWTLELWALAKRFSKKVALENPMSVIFPHLKSFGAHIQYIHPWMFGHTENKKTGLALHGLNPLIETNNVRAAMETMPKSQTDRIHLMPPGPNRKRDRSETYAGIAKAMAEQWGKGN